LYLAVIVAIVVLNPATGIANLAVLGLALLVPVSSVISLWLLNRRVWPAMSALAWSNESAEVQWRTAVGDPYPGTAIEAVSRLANVPGDDATYLRTVWLGEAGELEELRSAIDAWEPRNAVDVARRERAASRLNWLHGKDDGLDGARKAAAAIGAPDDRRDETARVLIEIAHRANETGRDPFPSLKSAADVLSSAGGFPAGSEAAEIRRRGTRAIATRSAIVSGFVAVFCFLLWRAMATF